MSMTAEIATKINKLGNHKNKGKSFACLLARLECDTGWMTCCNVGTINAPGFIYRPLVCPPDPEE